MCFLILLILPVSAHAFAVKTEGAIYVGADETVKGTLYAVGNTITVDGTVTGDVICAGQSITINGSVEGDVICGGQSVIVNGQIGGSVRAAGNTIQINASVGRTVQAFGAAISLGSDADTGSDMLIAGAFAEVRGKVGGDLHGSAAYLNISGEVVGNVRFKMDSGIQNEAKGMNFKNKDTGIVIADTAIINGDLVYSAIEPAAIADSAVINGELTYNEIEQQAARKKIFMGWAWGRLYSIFSALVIGLVLITIWRKQITELTDKMNKQIGPAIGWGIIIMFITPIIAILLLITIIGIPLAFLLLGIWIIALVLSKVFVGILVGRRLMEKISKKKQESLIWAMILGIVVTWLIFSIPGLGWILALIAMWYGLGGLWLYFRKT